MKFFVAAGSVPAFSANVRWSVAAFAARLRRLAGLRPSSRSSQRRMVSRPISMPSRRKPDARVSGESPAWCRRSNSSRYGFSCAVAWLRGCRTCSTAWANVVGRGGVSVEYAGSDMGADGEWYEQRAVSASGAVGSWSKRQRLDVGVIPLCFLLVLVDRLTGLSGWFVDLRFGWLDWFVGLSWMLFVFGGFVEWLSLVILSEFCWGALDWFSGGGGC